MEQYLNSLSTKVRSLRSHTSHPNKRCPSGSGRPRLEAPLLRADAAQARLLGGAEPGRRRERGRQRHAARPLGLQVHGLPFFNFSEDQSILLMGFLRSGISVLIMHVILGPQLPRPGSRELETRKDAISTFSIPILRQLQFTSLEKLLSHTQINFFLINFMS